MSEIQVPVEFIAEFSGAAKSLNNFAKEANDSLKPIQSAFEKLKIAAIALAAFEFGKKIAEGLADVVNEAAEADRTLSLLNQTLKASGDFSEQNVRAFQNMADELSKVSRFDDDAILSQVRLAKQFNTTNKEAERLIRAAVDLAAATGEDLPAAVQALGQTLDGTVGRIGQKIPILQSLTREQLLAGDAIDIVAKRFRGFAGADLDTFGGALGQITKGFKELEKAFGASIVDNKSVIAVFQSLSGALDLLVDFIKQNRVALIDFVTSGIKFAVQSFGVLSEVINLVYRQFAILKAQVFATAGGFSALTAAFTDPIEGFHILRDTITGYKKDMEDIGKTSLQFDKVTKSAADLSVKIEKIQESNLKLAKTTKDVADGFDSQTNAFKRFDTQILEKVKALKEELKSIGIDKLQTLTNQYDYQVSLINKAYDYEESLSNNKDKLERERIALLNKLKLKYDQEYYDQLSSKIQQVYQNPFSVINERKNPNGELGLSSEAQTGIAAGLGAASNALEGRNGAVNIVAAAGSAIATYFLGPLGQVVGPILKQLSAGPDVVRKMADDFAKSLPEVITSIIKAADAFGIEMTKNVPLIVNGFIDALPDLIADTVGAVPEVIGAVIEGIPRIIASIVTKLPAALVRTITKIFTDAGGAFIGKVLEGAVRFVGKILEGAAQFIAKLLDGISHPFGKNGTFLNLSGGGFGIGGNKGLLGGGVISGILKQDTPSGSAIDDGASSSERRNGSGPREIHVNVRVGHNQLAKAIVDVKRLGYRLEPI